MYYMMVFLNIIWEFNCRLIFDEFMIVGRHIRDGIIANRWLEEG